jgi:hypothetical protein
MKKIKISFLMFAWMIAVSLISRGQTLKVPNGNFEVWDNFGSFSIPDNWPTSDLLWHFNGFPTTTVTQDLNSHTGNFAVRISADTSKGKIWPGFIVTKFAMAIRPDHLAFYHLDSLPVFNRAEIAIGFFKYNTVTKVNDSIGGAVWGFPGNVSSSYTLTKIPLYYVSSDTTKKPDSASIKILIKSDPTALKQGYILVDDISLLKNSGIETASTFDFKVFPNPAASQIFIQTETTSDDQLVEIRDLNGRVVYLGLFQNQRLIPISIPDIPSGIYLIRVHTKEGTANSKIMVSK